MNQDGESEDRSSPAFSNLHTPTVHLGRQSEITDFAEESLPARSEISNTTWNSFSPLGHLGRYNRLGTGGRASRSSQHVLRRTTFLFNTGVSGPVGQFSLTLKDRGKFLWELFKLNYRMLISLTVTLFVAILVCELEMPLI